MVGLVRDVFVGTANAKRRHSGARHRNPPAEALEARLLLAGTGYFLGGQHLGSHESFGVELGDLDGDGDLDAFVANLVEGGLENPWSAAPNKVWVNTEGIFADSGQNLGAGASQHLALGDLNGDGHLDAFVGNVGGNTVWLNNGSGSFADSGQSLGDGDSLHVALADLDGDGDLDAAVANLPFGTGGSADGEVWINQGVNSGNFSALGSNLWTQAGGIALGDVDGDGDSDAFVTRLTAHGDDDNEPLPDQLWLNQGNGTFAESGQDFGSRVTLGVALADFDGDGDLDAFSAGHDDDVPSRLFINQGLNQSGTHGVFADSGQAIGNGSINRISVVNLDGDPDLDIFATRSRDFAVGASDQVYLNQGGNSGGAVTFTETGQTLALTDSVSVALGDINGDGAIDAFVGNADDAGNAANRVWLNQPHPVITYPLNGNVPIDVPASDGLLAGLGSVTISNVDTSETDGTLNVDQATGAFDYTPVTGFFGVDTFTITLSDDRTFIVSMDVHAATWFVDPTAAAGGDGSLAAPFQSLDPLNDAANDVDRPNDLIFIKGPGDLTVSGANGFELEFGQSLITSWSNPFSVPEFLANIDHPIAPFSSGLPMGFTGRPTLSNSTANAPVVTLLGENFFTSIDINPAGASDAFLIDDVAGNVFLHNIDLVPGSGTHAYNGITAKNSSLYLNLFGFRVDTAGTSTTSGTTFNFDGNSALEFRANTTFVHKSGGGLLNVTNTSGPGEVVFEPSSNLWIDGGDFGFHLQDNPQTGFGFDSDFFLIDVTNGITAINSGTIEMPRDEIPAQRDVEGNDSHALRVERTSTGQGGWHLDQVNAFGATNGVILKDVDGRGIFVNELEIVDTTSTAVRVSDSPNLDVRFRYLLVQGENVIVDTAAGTGVAGIAGDGGQATAAQIDTPVGIAVDRWGNTFIADAGTHVIRRVDRITGVITTIAGTGTSGFSGDGGAAMAAQLFFPERMTFDDEDNLYFGDKGNNRIRRIDAKTGVITTIAGNGSVGFGGDGGQATDAVLDGPSGLAFHPHDGSLYFADEHNHRIRRIDMETGLITTVVGTGEAGTSPTETPPSQAKLHSPKGIMFFQDSSAEPELVIADSGNHRIVGVDWDDNTTFSDIGTGVAGNNGTEAADGQTFQLNSPDDVVLLPEGGGVLISDSGNHRLVRVEIIQNSGPGGLPVEVVSGNGVAGFVGDGGTVEAAQYSNPLGLAVAPGAQMFIADSGNHRVRQVEFDFNPGEGIRLENSPNARFTFDHLSVRATGEAFVADNAGTVNIGDVHEMYGLASIYGVRAMLQAENGRALDVTDTTLSNGRGGAATFRHISSFNSPRDGIVLDNARGHIFVESGYIEDANQEGLNFTAGIAIEEGEGNVTIHSTIVNTKGQSVSVLGRTGGDIHLVTPIQHFTAGVNAVSIKDNTAGSTTLHRSLDQAPAQSNNGQHVVTFNTEGEAPPLPNSEVSFVDSGQLLGNLSNDTSIQYTGVALGDLDGDGDLDAFVTGITSDLVPPGNDGTATGRPNLVFINNAGTFTDSGQQLGNEASGHVQLGDFDNDGDLDAFVANVGANEIWLNDGSGNFADSGQELGEGGSFTVSLGDVDGDGDLDAVVTNAIFTEPGSASGGEVWINQGLHSGVFQDTTTSIWDTLEPTGVTLGDVDNDGDIDAFVVQNWGEDSDRTEQGVPDKLLLNQGDGTFVDSGVVFAPGFGISALLEDFDGDGDLDVFVGGAREFPDGNSRRDPNRYYANLGGAQGGTIGTFGDPVLYWNENQDQGRIAAGDFDNDGDLDVFVANLKASVNDPTDGRNRVYVNQGGLQGGVAGSFTDNGQQLGNFHTIAPAVGDLNGDGLVDVFTTNGGSPNRVWLNSTDGLSPPPPSATPVEPFQRIEPFGSLISKSNTNVAIGANQTLEFTVQLDSQQVLAGFVDTNTSSAVLSIELVGISEIITGTDGFIVLPAQQIGDGGTYTVRVTSDTATNVELVLSLNAVFEIPDSSDGSEFAIDSSLDSGPNGGRWAAIGITDGSPDVDEFTVDLTGHVGETVDILLTGFEGQHYEGGTLEFFGPDGTTVLATGTATPLTGGINALNSDLAILDFPVRTDGVYTARVSASFDDIAYTLIVAYDLSVDVEPNNDRINDPLRNITANQDAIGYLDAATDPSDFFEIDLTAGQSVEVSTAFAHSPELSPINTLNPELEIFGPAGSSLVSDLDSGEGVHSKATFTAPATGTYVIRVGATSGTGEYLLLTSVEDASQLTLAIVADAIAENGGAGATTATVTRDSDTTNPLTVTLLSSDTSEATVVGTITIPAGQTTSSAFNINAIDDAIVDGTQTVTVTASATDHASATATVDITDNDTAALTISISAASISEDAGVTATTGTVTRNTPTTTALTVTLTSNDTGEATVPATVTIPAGASSVGFDISAIDDDIVEGPQTVTIEATATGLASSSASVLVNDNDTADEPVVLSPSGPTPHSRPEFTWSPVNGAESYEFWLVLTGGDANPVLTSTVSTTSYLPDVDLAPGRYRTWVRANLVNGSQTEWANSAFRIDTPVVIDELPFHAPDLTPEITWPAIPGAVGYRVSIGNLTEDTVITDEIVTSNSFAVQADLGFGKHRIWVRAMGVNDFEAKWSPGINYYVGPDLINRVNSTTDVTPTFAWESLADVASIQLYVAGGNAVVVNESGLITSSFTVSSDLENGFYRWWIRPTHTNGRVGEWSPQGRLAIGGNPIVITPESPTNDSTVQVTWGSIDGAGSYEIYLFNDDGLGLIHRQEGITRTSYDYHPLPDGNYRVWIRSYTIDGQPDLWSQPHRFVIDAATTSLTATPSGPIGATFNESPTFTWNADADADAGATRFDVYVTDGETVIEKFDIAETSFTPVFPLAAGPVRWWVRAKDINGDAGPWAGAEANTAARPKVISLSGPYTQPRPTFQWEPVQGAERYTFYLENDAGVVIRDDDVQGTSYAPSVDLASGDYRFWIQAIDGDGLKGAWSQATSVTIQLAAGESPTASLSLTSADPASLLSLRDGRSQRFAGRPAPDSDTSPWLKTTTLVEFSAAADDRDDQISVASVAFPQRHREKRSVAILTRQGDGNTETGAAERTDKLFADAGWLSNL